MHPWEPQKWKKHEVAAIQAVHAGKATEDQQKAAMKYIIEGLGMVGQPVWFPDERETSYANGRQYVGLQLIKLIKLNLGVFKDDGRS